jgi:hypothetical protein
LKGKHDPSSVARPSATSGGGTDDSTH